MTTDFRGHTTSPQPAEAADARDEVIRALTAARELLQKLGEPPVAVATAIDAALEELGAQKRESFAAQLRRGF